MSRKATTLVVSMATDLDELIALMDNVIGIHSGGSIPDDPQAD